MTRTPASGRAVPIRVGLCHEDDGDASLVNVPVYGQGDRYLSAYAPGVDLGPEAPFALLKETVGELAAAHATTADADLVLELLDRVERALAKLSEAPDTRDKQRMVEAALAAKLLGEDALILLGRRRHRTSLLRLAAKAEAEDYGFVEPFEDIGADHAYEHELFVVSRADRMALVTVNLPLEHEGDGPRPVASATFSLEPEDCRRLRDWLDARLAEHDAAGAKSVDVDSD